MPDRNRNTYPQSYVPALPGQADIPQFTPPLAPPVVQASNQASPPAVAAVAFAVILVIALVVGLAGAMVLRWDARMAFVASVGLAIGGSLLVLIVINGDLPAVVEIRHHSKIELERIDAQSDAITTHYEYMTLAETNRHAEEEARIKAHASHTHLQGDVAYLMDQVAALRPLRTDSAAPPAKAFVAAKPDEARLACEKWLAKLWDHDNTPKFVPGQLPMPWNSPEWRRQPWRGDAQRLLESSGILVPSTDRRTFTVVPTSRRDAMTMLDSGR